jgi:transcriptional regulator with GAF, ATPase, and Fis domain
MVFSFVDITELTHLRRRLKTEQSFAGIVGRNAKMLELFDTIREVAEVDVPVLIQGESGTGKELVAAAIHNESLSADKPFVPVNCGALPEGVLESELFGHVKGAFTGAVRDRKGRFELANGGAIFLDEIGELPGAMQVKLLRVLQEGTFQRVGGEETIKVDVRVISATNKNLAEEVAAGRFREDLFYRLCVVPIYLPSLRERRNDIPLLAEHLLRKALTEVGREDVGLSSEAIDVMMDYDWPGNVRELENAIRYALVKCRDNLLLPEHLPLNTLKAHIPTQPSPKKQRKRKLDAETVWRTLEETGGNKLEAAIRLGVSRATLYRFLQEREKMSKITAQ